MTQWTRIGLTWRQFLDDHVLAKQAGVVVEIEHSGDGSIKQVLIGELNDAGGGCDHCGLSDDHQVVRVLDLRAELRGLIDDAQAMAATDLLEAAEGD